jgi:hypothetical protein
MDNRQRIDAFIKQSRYVLDSAEVATIWTGSTDVSALTTSTTHREGTLALSFAKSGTTQDYGQISRTLDAVKQMDLTDYLDGQLTMWISLSSLTNIASVSLIIGEDASNNYVYTIADTELTTGYQRLSFDIDSPTSTTGAGAAWSSIGYIAVKVNFDATGNTLTAILIDSIIAQYSVSMNVDSLSVSGTGLATSAKQDTGNTSLSNIDTNTALPTGISHGNKTVTTAGTDVALVGSSTPCKRVTIQALTSNSGKIAIGGSGVDATIPTGTGILLSAGESYSFDIDNLTDVYIDSTVSGEGVRFTYQS